MAGIIVNSTYVGFMSRTVPPGTKHLGGIAVIDCCVNLVVLRQP